MQDAGDMEKRGATREVIDERQSKFRLARGE